MIHWMVYALVSVVCWGLYGVMLHMGQVAMEDPVSGRMKAFLWVGLAYLLIAVVVPAIWLGPAALPWRHTTSGIAFSLAAGLLGAIGALGVLLAFGSRGIPSVVMSIVFAGAPIVNAITALLLHPPQGGWGALRPQFLLGIVLAAIGASMVTIYKPTPAAIPKDATQNLARP